MLGFVLSLAERFVNRDERALARLISLLEAGLPQGQALLKELRVRAGARIVGVTGSPGSGKSTLVDALIGVARSRGERVAIVAVDPSSPFSGGAILGDRIRMSRWHQDPDVYIRSMATRGQLGGLAAVTLQVVALLDAYGFDLILIETVGVGQSEVDIVRVADTTLLVLTPGAGDGVQAFKAGVMEIADVFTINKADLPGAARFKREVKAALGLGHPLDLAWSPPVFDTIAATEEGVEALFDGLSKHHQYLIKSGKLESLRRERARFEIASLLTEELRKAVQQQEDAFIEDVLTGKKSSSEAVKALLAGLEER